MESEESSLIDQIIDAKATVAKLEARKSELDRIQGIGAYRGFIQIARDTSLSREKRVEEIIDCIIYRNGSSQEYGNTVILAANVLCALYKIRRMDIILKYIEFLDNNLSFEHVIEEPELSKNIAKLKELYIEEGNLNASELGA